MIADNFTEQDEADAIERIDQLLGKRRGQQAYIAQAQLEVVDRMRNLDTIAVELNRAQAWLDRIHGREPRRTPTHREFMDMLDQHEAERERLREAGRQRVRGPRP